MAWHGMNLFLAVERYISSLYRYLYRLFYMMNHLYFGYNDSESNSFTSMACEVRLKRKIINDLLIWKGYFPVTLSVVGTW
jgi:predicted sulfurtransferase